MVFHWSLSHRNSPQVSRTRPRILAILSNAVIWIVTTRPPTSKSSRLFNNPWVIVPKAPITIGKILTFMLHSFFNSLGRSRYLSFFSHSFRFILWSSFRLPFSSILSELFFPPVICFLFTSAWIQQDKFEYTSLVCSFTWDFVGSLFLFFLQLLDYHNTEWDVRLISDKTKINYRLFHRGKVFSLGIRLTRLTIPRVWIHSKEKLFIFSQCSLHSKL